MRDPLSLHRQEKALSFYLLIQLISLIGYMAREAIVSLLIVDIVGAKDAPLYVGIVQAGAFFSGAILGIWIGSFVDQHDKRRVLQITGIVNVVQGLILAALTFRGHHGVSASLIITIAFIGGIAGAIDNVARNSIIGDIVQEKKNISHGAIWFGSLYTVAMVCGQGLAGNIIVSYGYGWSFILCSASALTLVVGFEWLKYEHKAPTTPRMSATQIIRYVFLENKNIRTMVILATLATIFGFTYNRVLVIIAKEMFGGGPLEYSLMARWAGYGAIIGSITSIWWGGSHKKTLTTVGCFLMAFGQFGLAYATTMPFALGSVTLCGFGLMSCFPIIRGEVLQFSAHAVRASVTGLNNSMFYLGLTVNAPLAGKIIQHTNCPTLLLILGAGMFIIGCFVPFVTFSEKKK